MPSLNLRMHLSMIPMPCHSNFPDMRQFHPRVAAYFPRVRRIRISKCRDPPFTLLADVNLAGRCLLTLGGAQFWRE